MDEEKQVMDETIAGIDIEGEIRRLQARVKELEAELTQCKRVPAPGITLTREGLQWLKDFIKESEEAKCD